MCVLVVAVRDSVGVPALAVARQPPRGPAGGTARDIRLHSPDAWRRWSRWGLRDNAVGGQAQARGRQPGLRMPVLPGYRAVVAMGPPWRAGARGDRPFCLLQP